MVTMRPPMISPQVGRLREPILPGMPRREDEIRWARRRPLNARTPKPVAGQRVGLRLEPNGPVLLGTIVMVRDTRPTDTRAGAEIDWNVWRYVVDEPGQGPRTHAITGQRAVDLVDDPWWDVVVRTDGPVMTVDTREARLPGEPGWLPLNGE